MNAPAPATASPRSRRAPWIALLALCAGSASCATYTERTEAALDDFRRGHLDAAAEALGDPDRTGSRFLAGAEAGTAALTAGRWEDARRWFELAAGDVRDLEDRALVSPQNLGEALASWALNDTSHPYRGEGFERVYVHACLALTYLAEGALDSVYVEARRANDLLETEEELYDADYGAGGFGHLLSAVAYELLGQPDEAYIDYRRMADKGVGLDIAGPALVRLADVLGRDDDLATWLDRFGPVDERPVDSASIVVLGGVGLAPFKTEVRLHIPTSDGLVNIAGPEYVQVQDPVVALELLLPRSSFALRTAMVEDVVDVAEENLSDRLAWTYAKSAARGLLKRELTRELENQHGGWGRLAGEVFSLVTERADLRCWRTLPAEWHAARAFVAPGEHELVLRAIGGEQLRLGTFELVPGETMFLVARSVGPYLYAHAIGGRPIVVSSDSPGL